MNKEDIKNETEKKPEAQETPEVIESPEKLRQEMTEKSKEEVERFKKESQKELAYFEGGNLAIDNEDKEALQKLDQRAKAAENKLLNEIGEKEWTPDSDFPPPLDEEMWNPNGDVPPPLPDEKKYHESGMKERNIKKPELLDKKEASKKFLKRERERLAREILVERKAQYERLSALKKSIENAINDSERMEGQQADEQYGIIAKKQSDEANMLAERLESAIDKQGNKNERENVAQLISNSENIKSLKAKIQEHYAKADEIAKEYFENIQKSVEQTTLRNNAFIVHTFLLNEEIRHNANSNISGRATFKDDLDILLSLEPSISTSSVIPGSRQGLWGKEYGVIIGGGDIFSANYGDAGTVSRGIKKRIQGEIVNSKRIDALVSDKKERGYNEIVVNNPKVFGFFQNVEIDEFGRMIGFKKKNSKKENEKYKDNFMIYMKLAIRKGIPIHIMTPDRRLFEFKSISDDGIVSVGQEITPEQVALGRAGLPDEKRIEIGEKIISKNLFRHIDEQKEAKGIVAELSGQEKSEIELSREEYLNYIKDETGIHLGDFPENLRGDKEFLMEAAKYHHDPTSAYNYATDSLQRDINFIKYIYRIYKEKKQDHALLYSLMPKDIRKNEEIVLLALENDDSYNNLEISLAESPLIWEKIIDSLIKKKDSRSWSYLDAGETKEFDIEFTQFFMKEEDGNSVDMSKKIIADDNFIQKLNSKYPDYKFEVNDREHVTVTRLA